MNYNHAYHAGNFADVIKHVILTALIHSLSRKQSPFCYIDTHAGSGYYDLSASAAQKSKEFLNGIEKIIQAPEQPEVVKQYLGCVHKINNELSNARYASLRYYPGSPSIAQCLSRPFDRIIACELHPKAYQALKNTFANNRKVAVHHMDGFLGLKAFLPPTERRGVVLIDPPFEDPGEFTRIVHSLAIALKRWEKGIYAIWYPIKEKNTLARFYRTLKNDIKCPTLIIEMTIFPDIPDHLNGCGVAIINPPWQFDHLIEKLLPWLWQALSHQKQGFFSSYFI
jgi:23S rRNA (adenine2030-N6)-methyltransferase